MSESLSPARRAAVTAALLLGTLLASIEATVVGVAMPTIVERLGGLALYPWVISAYLLTQTVTIPLYGRLADLYGRRLSYVVGVSLFLLGSLACGLAPSMPALVGARALQGLGAGVVLPLTMTIFGDLYPPEARTKLQGLFSLVWGVSSLGGPLAGGAIVLHWSWRWVFLLNVPFGLVSAVAVAVLLRERGGGPRRSLDLAGAGVLCLATLLLLLSTLPEGQRPAVLHPGLLVAAAAAAAIVFVRIESRAAEPLLPLHLFRRRVQQSANGSGVLIGAVVLGTGAYLPLYVQAVLGGSPVEAGAAMIPMSVGWTTAALAAGWIVRRVGFRALVRAGSLLVASGAALAWACLRADWPAGALAGTLVYGLGMGVSISSFTVSIQEDAPAAERGIATAVSQFSRSMGGAVGVALLGTAVTGAAALPGAGSTAAVDLAALRTGLELVFALMAALAVGAAAVAAATFPRVTVGPGR